MNKTLVYLVFAALLLALVGIFAGPISQPEAYHNFADQRTVFWVVNGWDVFSNILFAVAGIWGLYLLLTPKKVHFINERSRVMWLFVAIGLILTAIGSSYYHLNPNNSTLVWDRLPMTIIFMSYVAALIGERINMRLGLLLWPLLLIFGLYSVLQWHATDDLRLYLSVQLFTILTTGILLLTPSPYDRRWDIGIVVLLFGLARLFEIYDHQILEISKNSISGHTLKHLAAGMAGIWLMYMLTKRRRL